MKHFFITLLLCTAAILLRANTYYLSSTGNNANNGKSISEAWKTLDAVNSFVFTTGDIILLQGGATFTGSIEKENVSGITINSYGTGKSTISSGIKRGIYFGNASGITIKNIIIKGGGYMTTARSINGIDFYIHRDANNDYDNFIVDNVEIYGYGGAGISFLPESATYGFNHVRITNSVVHDNGMIGIQTNGSWDNTKNLTRYSNTDVYIANCQAYSNHGRNDFTTNRSGSGIMIGGTIGGIVEYCEAYENGKDNGSSTNGPVGIYTDNSKKVVIQYCVSHDNKGGASKVDGGGFNIDGGSINCVIQECDSYNNEGAGFGLYQWATGNKWSNDTIRNCVSTNDARNQLYGSVSIWGASSTYKVTNAELYGNRINLDNTGKVFSFNGNNFSSIEVHDNAFCVASLSSLYTTLSTNVTISNNSFPCLILSVRTGSFKVKRVI